MTERTEKELHFQSGREGSVKVKELESHECSDPLDQPQEKLRWKTMLKKTHYPVMDFLALDCTLRERSVVREGKDLQS